MSNVLMEVKFTTDDPYEKRLFELFKNHQGKDQTGLDRDGLVKLCMSLELRDRGEALVTLLTSKRTATKNDNGNEKWLVSFQDFRAGLLQILGEELKSNENEGKFIYYVFIIFSCSRYGLKVFAFTL